MFIFYCRGQSQCCVGVGMGERVFLFCFLYLVLVYRVVVVFFDLFLGPSIVSDNARL